MVKYERKGHIISINLSGSRRSMLKIARNYWRNRKKLLSVQAKLSEEIKTWKAQYKELTVQSKSELAGERAKRERIVKSQLDQSEAIEDELCKYIVAMDEMRTQTEARIEEEELLNKK